LVWLLEIKYQNFTNNKKNSMKTKNLLIIGGVLVLGYFAYKKFMPKKGAMTSINSGGNGEAPKEVVVATNSGIPNTPTSVEVTPLPPAPTRKAGDIKKFLSQL